MTEILKNDIEKAKLAKRLILCPNTDSYEVRKFLAENNFSIISEEVVYDYKYYFMESYLHMSKDESKK